MSISYYTYLGPIIQIKKDATIDEKLNICSNEGCKNHNLPNTIKSGDKFCTECGNKVSFRMNKKIIEPTLQNMMSLNESLIDFEDVLEDVPYAAGNIIINSDEYKNCFISKSATDVNVIMLSPERIEKMMDEFLSIDSFKNVITSIKEIVGEENVEVSFGLANYGYY